MGYIKFNKHKKKEYQKKNMLLIMIGNKKRKKEKYIPGPFSSHKDP